MVRDSRSVLSALDRVQLRAPGLWYALPGYPVQRHVGAIVAALFSVSGCSCIKLRLPKVTGNDGAVGGHYTLYIEYLRDSVKWRQAVRASSSTQSQYTTRMSVVTTHGCLEDNVN